MSLGIIALAFAFGAAGWLLVRVAKGRAIQDRNMTILKGIVWLSLVAALFVAKLWPLALMVFLAAGGVMAIELWKDRVVAETEAAEQSRQPKELRPAKMTPNEAFEILGLPSDASLDDIKTAHKKLISQLHPDKGGTDYLAAKINEARDLLTNKSDQQ